MIRLEIDMGTYKRVRITTNTDADGESGIFLALDSDKQSDLQFCLNKFSESTKWWPDDLIKILREKCPKVMFRVDVIYDGSSSDYDPDTTFYCGKQYVSIEDAFPSFPTKSQFQSGRTKRRVREVKAKSQAKAALAKL